MECVFYLLFILFVYYLVLWVIKKSELYLLYFAIFCFIMILRSIAFNGCFIDLSNTAGYFFSGDVLVEIQNKIYFITEVLGAYALSGYVISLFPQRLNKKIYISASIFLPAVIVLLCIVKTGDNPVIAMVCHGMTFLTLLWIIIILIVENIRKKRGSLYVLWGFLWLLPAFIPDIFNLLGNSFLLCIRDTGIVLFFICQTVVVVNRSNHISDGDIHFLRDEREEKPYTLAQENQQAEYKGEQKTLFFMHMACEMKTALTVVRDNISKYCNKTKMTNELAVILKHINALYNSCVNLLDSEGIEQGRLTYSKDIFIDACRELLGMMNRHIIFARKKKIHLTYSGGDSLFLKIDPYAFEKIIYNLISNAIKNTGADGHIDVSIMSRAETIVITISDDGIGISETRLERIFQPFYRTAPENRHPGVPGLGLYIVKSIVSYFNGIIHIQSKEHTGTVVTVTFPRYTPVGIDCIDKEISRDQIDRDAFYRFLDDTYDKNKPTVFFVDDNVDLISFMHSIMGEDFNVLYARNGKEGLEKLNKGPKPDIIISGIVMDTMDGYEFHSRLISIERLLDIPFIFLTDRTGRNEKLESLKRGVIDYIYKPFDKDILVQKIKALVKNRHAHSEFEIGKMEKRLSSLLRKTGDDEFLSFEKKCQIYKLSPREKEVLRGLLEGLQIKEIADKLCLSIHTVRNHIRHIYHKCKVQNRVEMINLFR